MPYISLTISMDLLLNPQSSTKKLLGLSYMYFSFCFFLLGKSFRQIFGDEALGALNIKKVEVARNVGAAAKFTGSGGAVVAFCPGKVELGPKLMDSWRFGCAR